MMPEMDGMETAEAIRKLHKDDGTYQRTPIVMLTANAGSEQRDVFLRNDIDDLLEKPIEIKKLDTLLEQWIPKEKQIVSSPVPGDTPELPAPYIPHKTIDIPNVNVLSGLNNTGGSMEVYLNILSNFCQEARDHVQQIKQAVETNDVSLYTVLVHGLKGSAKSIGADEFSGFANRIEEEISNGDLTVIPTQTGTLLENLHTLTDNIYTVINQDTGETESGTDMNILKPQLQVLKDALIKMDIEMVNKLFMDYSFSHINTRTRDIIADIEKDVLMFEYGKAIEKIDLYL
jgi:CheY-like chemotaxis protein